ncbi:MAG: GTA-gp10 family protein [Rhizomicrobium sp.]
MNKIRGEAVLLAGGQSYRLLLTLGALAEIEDGLGLANLSEVAARLAQARANDLAIVAAALLRGGGQEMTPDDVLRLPCELGALTSAVIAAFDAAAIKTNGGGGTAPFAGSAS